MSLGPALIRHNQIPIRRSDVDVAHLPLDVQQVRSIANRKHGVGVAELIRLWQEGTRQLLSLT